MKWKDGCQLDRFKTWISPFLVLGIVIGGLFYHYYILEHTIGCGSHTIYVVDCIPNIIKKSKIL